MASADLPSHSGNQYGILFDHLASPSQNQIKRKMEENVKLSSKCNAKNHAMHMYYEGAFKLA